MKNKRIVSLALVLLLVLCTTIGTFAATSTSKTISGYTWKGNLYPENPLITNPYAWSESNSGAAIYYIKAVVTVINTDGSASSKSSSENNCSWVYTPAQYANTFTSSGVKFTGSHVFSDANIGSWTGSTSYTY